MGRTGRASLTAYRGDCHGASNLVPALSRRSSCRRRDEAHSGSSYDVKGREALTLTECAAQLSNVTGRTIPFENETEDEA